MTKKTTVSADSLRNTLKGEELKLGVAYRTLVEYCKDEEPDRDKVMILVAYINSLAVLSGQLKALLETEMSGGVAVSSEQVLLLRAYINLGGHYREELANRFNTSIALH